MELAFIIGETFLVIPHIAYVKCEFVPAILMPGACQTPDPSAN